MDIVKAADALKELPGLTRLGIFKELVKFGYTGLLVGELQKASSGYPGAPTAITCLPVVCGAYTPGK